MVDSLIFRSVGYYSVYYVYSLFCGGSSFHYTRIVSSTGFYYSVGSIYYDYYIYSTDGVFYSLLVYFFDSIDGGFYSIIGLES